MVDLIGFADATSETIREYLSLADQFATPEGKPHTPNPYRLALDRKTVGLLFFEPSTRTRASFELAVSRLGGHPLLLGQAGTSVEKGESVLQTCLNLRVMGVEAFVVRHQDQNLPFALSDKLDCPIINAGNGVGEHPTQSLLDALTLIREFDRTSDFSLDGLNISIIGDIVHSRVARSDIAVFQKLGANVTVGGPGFLLPEDPWGAAVAKTRSDALADADVVMFLRIQKERLNLEFDLNDFIAEWSVDEKIVESEMKPNAKIMHPGPVMRGVEITGAVADSPRSLILRQVAFGVAVRQAVILKTMGLA